MRGEGLGLDNPSQGMSKQNVKFNSVLEILGNTFFWEIDSIQLEAFNRILNCDE